MSRFFVQTGEHFARFERDEDGVATGRVEWVPDTYNATGFDKLTELAEIAEYTHLAGFEVVTSDGN